MTDYLDLLVVDGNFILDIAANPLTVQERESIAQDIKHMVIESGYLVELVAERHPEKIRQNLQRIERIIDLDSRIVPGTAQASVAGAELFYLTATTVDYGHLTVEIL
jgi:hypothetical protein